MEVSNESMDLIEKIKEFRGCKEIRETLEFENKVLREQNEDLRNAFVELQKDFIDRKKLLEQIEYLKKQNQSLRLELESYSEKFRFLVTTPDSTCTVYGDIRNSLSKAKREVLVCSPWITYLVDEFKDFKKHGSLKVITNFRRDDVKKGITDPDKLRVLQNMGAEVRYNNNVHAKMVIVDSEVAIISSANLTGRGLRVNYEAGVKVNDKKPVKMAEEFFYGVWEESRPLTEEMIRKFY